MVNKMGCTGVVIVNSDEALAGKNSDTNNNTNETPKHIPSKTFNLTYATTTGQKTVSVQTKKYTGCYGGVQSYTNMPPELPLVVWGTNESKLSVFYTALGSTYPSNSGMCATAEWQSETTNPLGLKTTGRALCTLLLALYDNIADILNDLDDPDSPIGQNNRGNADAIGIIDRFGNGVVMEISRAKVVYKIVNEYFCIDNAMRMWDINPTGQAINVRSESQSGNRTLYIKTAIDEVLAEKGKVTYRDMVQKIMRYIKHKEDGNAPFSINESGTWDIVNDGTASSFVASSKGFFFGEYGNPAIVGLYLPHIAGVIPANGSGDWDSTLPASSMRGYVDNVIREYVGEKDATWIYDPIKVREKQALIFQIENELFDKVDSLSLITDEDIKTMQQNAVLKWTSLINTNITVEYSSPQNVPATINGTVVNSGSSILLPIGTVITINVPNKITPEVVIVNSAIHLTQSFDGGGKIYKHGDNLKDTAIFFLDGNDIILSNMIIDDGGAFPNDGKIRVQAAVFMKGTGNKIVNCWLKNCMRYGFTTLGATDWEIHDCVIEDAQHCISGSGAVSKNGKVYNNIILSCWCDAFKMKNWQNVEIYNNKAYLHESSPSQTVNPQGVSFNSDSPNLNMNVDVHDNEFIKEDGLSRQAFGFTVEGMSQNVPYVWGDLAYDSNGNIIHTGIPNLKFRNNKVTKIGSGGTTYAGIIRGNYIEATNNIFTKVDRQIVVYSDTEGNVTTPNTYN